YDAIVTIEQKGLLSGKLTVGNEKAIVVAQSDMVAGPAIAMLGPGQFVGAAAVGVKGVYLGSKLGAGTFEAVLWVALDAEGHILGILPAGVPLLDGTFTPVGATTASGVTM